MPDPQPRVSRGFSPLPPIQPAFETIAERYPAIADRKPVNDYQPPAFRIQKSSPAATADEISNRNAGVNSINIPIAGAIDRKQGKAAKPKRRILRKLAGGIAVIAISAGALYYSAVFIGSKLPISTIANLFSDRTGTATTDIYLRPAPNANNDPIGLVTKNSKVRIISTQNNWHQVDIIEQGRPPQFAAQTASRGWLNGKYVEIPEN